MRDAACAAALARTYRHRVSAYRAERSGGETALCTGAPCALSRSAQVSAPAPGTWDQPLPETLYRLSLFTLPDRWFQLGDRLEVTDQQGRVYRGYASDSFCYPTHCVTVMEVAEVNFGQNSHETGAADAAGGEMP